MSMGITNHVATRRIDPTWKSSLAQRDAVNDVATRGKWTTALNDADFLVEAFELAEHFELRTDRRRGPRRNDAGDQCLGVHRAR
jgi:hypothetical protein